MNNTGHSMSERAAVSEAADPANLAVHQAAKQEVEASKEANKSAAGSAAGGVLSDATTAMGHAAGWIGAKLTGDRPATQTTVIDTRSGAVPPVNAGAYGTAAATQTGSAMPQGTVGGSYAPSPAVAQTDAAAHGEGFKAHAYAAMRGTGTALSHAKDALSDKLAAGHYDKYEGEQAAMQPKYPAVVTPASGTTAGSATG